MAAQKPTSGSRPPENALMHASANNADPKRILSKLEQAAEVEGYFHSLGDHHWVAFVDAGPTLVVSFETVERIASRPEQLPLLHATAEERGWSHLCIVADGATWFRDISVWRYFDRLVNDGFLEDFDRVLFYGAGMAGYAACAYAVTAPGATVLAISPVATLDPAEAGWDRRDTEARKRDFSSRYGYAPDMVEGAEKVFVLHDPMVREDAMHAALFRAKHVERIALRHIGARPEDALARMGLLPLLLIEAAEGALTGDRVARYWRARRRFSPYLNALVDRALATGHTDRALRICRNITQRLNAPTFVRRATEIAARQPAVARKG